MSLDPQIIQAVALLAQGDVVAIPTETVYGLGADATNELAVQKIFKAKGRPSFNPLIVHVLNRQWAEKIGSIPPQAYPLLDQYWPGPLTIVVPLLPQTTVAPSVAAGLQTIGIRVPKHPLFRKLLEQYGKPIAAPSANASNTLSCTTAEDVAKSLGSKVSLILDDTFPCEYGLESTIVDFSSPIPRILRHGAISQEALQLLKAPEGPLKAPGQMKRHYAPHLPLRLNVTVPHPGEAFLNFGSACPQETLNLSPEGNPEEAGRNLFHMLHTLDNPVRFSGIAVAPIPNKELGVAINDRLQRAATTEDTP